MADLYLERVPEDFEDVLTLELTIFQVGQMYRCTRREAIYELGFDGVVEDPDPWATLIHLEFYDAMQHARSGVPLDASETV